jgi:DNA-binding CsgD family transcriptional regulator
MSSPRSSASGMPPDTPGGPPPPSRPLSPREDSVVRCMARGLCYKRAAAVLGISAHTVRFHVLTIANILPRGEEDELEPRERVVAWSYWYVRLSPTLSEQVGA